MRRRYVKLCDVGDFDDPEVLAILEEILPERDPREHVERKVWEFAMLALYLREHGLLDDRRQALAVGAGDERMVFWLANRMGRVVATDVYGEGHFAGREASHVMLRDPASRAPFPYRRERLEVHRMDARSLDFPDDSFDVIFSLSSIEHFGSAADVRRAAGEIGRVLRPGGHALIATECFVRLHPIDALPVRGLVHAVTLGRRPRRTTLGGRRAAVGEAFTARELSRLIVEPSGLRLVQPLDRSLSAESWRNLTRLRPGARLEPATRSFYPHVLLKASRSVFTSVFLALEKP